jgi:Peptidase A4 family
MASTLLQTFDPPPAGFDLPSASPAELRQYGLPRRPDPDTEPDLYQHWQNGVARTRSIVRAELGRSPALDRLSAARRSRRGLPGDGGNSFSPSGWAGAVVSLADIGVAPPATTVSARWAVPTIDITDVTDPSSELVVGFWVGIDGGPILQAGTAAVVNGKNVQYYAWTEWFPTAPATTVTNFAVAPGDIVNFSVCNTTSLSGTLHGAVSMSNERTGVATTVGMNPPAGTVTEPGTQVEWIVEAPGSADLADFLSVVFLDCDAGTQQQSFGVSSAGLTEIEGSTAALTQASVINPDSVAVVWLGSS